MKENGGHNMSHIQQALGQNFEILSKEVMAWEGAEEPVIINLKGGDIHGLNVMCNSLKGDT
jgi:hypothetical protein